MNQQLRKRIIIASVVIIAVIVAVALVVGGQTSAQSMTVAQAKQVKSSDQKVQVEGLIVDNSYSIQGKTVTFAIYDSKDIAAGQLSVVYEGAISSTFGNGVTAICTGKIDNQGTLMASELVTKCPSKYEESTDALSVDKLLSYGDGILGKVVKVTGAIKAGTFMQNGTEKSFTLVDQNGAEIKVKTTSALSDAVKEGANVVLTGELQSSGSFNATDVSLRS